MSKSIAVVYLARTESGSAKDFVNFALSYRKFNAGVAHDLIIIHKGAATRPGTREAISYLFDGIPYTAIDRDDWGYDIQAYLKTSLSLSHEYVCFLNTYSEICADNWLAKLTEPLLSSPTVGMVGSTASYESLHSSFGMYCKVIWMCSTGLITYDHRVATEFRRQLQLHVPEWLASGPSRPDIAAGTTTALDTVAAREGFEAHWREVTKPGAPLFGLNQFKPFPNPHLRSNAFATRRELLNDLGFSLGDSKIECVRFETGIDGLPTRLAERGLSSILVGADGKTFGTERWAESGGFRLGNQGNILVKDNQVRAFESAPDDEKQHLSRLSWGAYAGMSTSLFSELGFPHERGNLRLAHTTRSRAETTSKSPMISIVIPTRNRLALVKDALYTVVSQSYSNWECIVFDNFSDEPLKEHVAAFKDPRIKCIRSDRFLPVTDSWNGAIDAATGDYITLLGDDDGLTPDFMKRVEFIVREHQNPDFIYTSLFQFFHPGVAPWEQAGYVIDLRYGHFFENQHDIFKLDPGSAQEAVTGSLDFHRNFAFNMQSFCFSKEFLNSLRLEGKVFHSPFPDYYLANVAMALGKVISISPKPIAVAGVSRKSFGFTLFNQMEEKGAALLATDLMADPMYKEFEKAVLPGPAYNTNFLITMYHVKHRLGDFTPSQVNLSRYRRLQIIRTLFKESEIDAVPLPSDYSAVLDAAELRWVDELATLSVRAKKGDGDAVARLAKIQSEAAMHGRPAKVVELDVGSFANLPQLFNAIKAGLIGFPNSVNTGSEQVALEDKAFDLKSLLLLGDQEFVLRAYLTLLRRPADPGGLAFYVGQLSNGTDRAEVLRALVTSPEGKARDVKLDGLDEFIAQKSSSVLRRIFGAQRSRSA